MLQSPAGDDIIGFVTRSRGVSIHRKDCANVITKKKENGLSPCNGAIRQEYPVNVEVEAWIELDWHGISPPW